MGTPREPQVSSPPDPNSPEAKRIEIRFALRRQDFVRDSKARRQRKASKLGITSMGAMNR